MKERIMHMTAAQRSQWFLFETNPKSPFYNNIVTFKVSGRVVNSDLIKALKYLVEKHETLRTRFYVEDGKFLQRISEKIDFDIPVIDLSSYSKEKSEEEKNRIERYMAEKVINIVDEYPFSFTLLKIKENETIILACLHHIISDGWSMRVIMNELKSIYRDILDNKNVDLELPYTYSMYSLEENTLFESDEFNKQRSFWIENLKGDIESTTLPLDKVRKNINKNVGKTKIFNLSKDIYRNVKNIASENGTTMFMFFITTFSIFLQKLTKENTVMFGTINANREKENTDKLIAFFANTLPLKLNIDKEISFIDNLESVTDQLIEIYDNKEVPFEIIVKDKGVKSYQGINPLFQIVFVYQNSIINSISDKDFTLDFEVIPNKTSKFDLAVHFFEKAEKIEVRFEYNSDLLLETTISIWEKQFVDIIEKCIKNPNAKIGELESISDEEKSIILNDFNNTERAYQRDSCISELLDENVRNYGENIALTKGGVALTYKELNNKSNLIAKMLIENGVKPKDSVAIVAEREIETILGIVGIVKAGAYYLPIDNNLPLERKKFILNDANSKLILTLSEFEGVEGVKSVSLLDIVKKDEEVENISIKINPEDLAYVMYTSGSTGNPKGVMVTQRNIIRLIKNNNFIDLTGLNVLQSGTMVFDASTYEIWGSLLNGGCLCLIDKEDLIDHVKLKKIITEKHIDTALFTVALFNQLVSEDISVFEKLKIILIGGDKLSRTHVNKLRENNSRIKIINAYGPT
ncbi:TPA: AMP-binding protein, partial [Streptococcus agalactiae]|nr:AMP-binding protein [Streptococcus agalactiae]